MLYRLYLFFLLPLKRMWIRALNMRTQRLSGRCTNKLTWQALRLSLISTWLVWVPTHMYTWYKKTRRKRKRVSSVKIKLTNNSSADWDHSRRYLFAIIQQHDVIISQVVLTEVWAFLRHGEITFLIGTSERRRGRGREDMFIYSEQGLDNKTFMRPTTKGSLTWRDERVSCTLHPRRTVSENQFPPRRSSLAPPLH